jgi:hypothetical protein
LKFGKDKGGMEDSNFPALADITFFSNAVIAAGNWEGVFFILSYRLRLP